MDVSEAIDSIHAVLGWIEEIEEDYPEVYEQGEDYFEGVYNNALTLEDRIEKQKHVTERQAEAIQKWVASVRKRHPNP